MRGSRPDIFFKYSGFENLEAVTDENRIIQVYTGQDDGTGIWTISRPCDHLGMGDNGGYNMSSGQGIEITVVAPKSYFLSSQNPPMLAASFPVFKEALVIVALESVDIEEKWESADNAVAPTIDKTRFTRVVAVPKGYEDKYYEAMGRGTREILHTTREVKVQHPPKPPQQEVVGLSIDEILQKFRSQKTATEPVDEN